MCEKNHKFQTNKNLYGSNVRETARQNWVEYIITSTFSHCSIKYILSFKNYTLIYYFVCAVWTVYQTTSYFLEKVKMKSG